jgi:hypothetical protein
VQKGSPSLAVAKEWGSRKSLVPPPPISQRSQAICASHAAHASTPSPSRSAAAPDSKLPVTIASQRSGGSESAVQKVSGTQVQTDTVGEVTSSAQITVPLVDSDDVTLSSDSQQQERLAFITQCLQVSSSAVLCTF